MSLELVFGLIHVPAALGWGALLLPVGAFRQRRRVAMLCGAAVAIVYTGLFFSGPEARVLAADYSLAGVGAFFAVPHLKLAGWAHYLVLDLWAGIWQAQEAERLRMSHWLLVPSLVLTSLIGPAGLLLFLATSWFVRRAGEPS